jgi:hypothetical protein
MLEAAYVDLAASRSIVGIQPKPPFYPLFRSLLNHAENQITVFFNDNSEKIESLLKQNSRTGLVDGGGTASAYPRVYEADKKTKNPYPSLLWGNAREMAFSLPTQNNAGNNLPILLVFSGKTYND